MRPWPVWIWMRRLSRQHRAGKPRLCRGRARLRPGSRRLLRMLPRQRSKSFQHQKHYLAQNPPPHDFYARYGVELVTGCHLRLYLHVSFGLIGRQARYRHGIGAIGVDGVGDARMLDGACGRLCRIGCERDISCGYALARRGVLGSAARHTRGRCRRGSLRRRVGFWCSVFARSSSLGCRCRIACSGISRGALVGLLLCLRACRFALCLHRIGGEGQTSCGHEASRQCQRQYRRRYNTPEGPFLCFHASCPLLLENYVTLAYYPGCENIRIPLH